MSAATFDLAYYRARIAALAEKGVFVGTSSWKYEGWLGQIYTPDRYEYRGKVAKIRLEDNCLAEYRPTRFTRIAANQAGKFESQALINAYRLEFMEHCPGAARLCCDERYCRGRIDP